MYSSNSVVGLMILPKQKVYQYSPIANGMQYLYCTLYVFLV